MVFNIFKILQVLFFGQWPDQCEAVPLLEVHVYKSSDSVFVFNLIRKSGLKSQRIFQILSGGNRLSLLVNELQTEISEHPVELGKVERVFVWFYLLIGSDLEVFRQTEDKRQVLNCIFVNGSNAVVDKTTTQ